MGRYKLGPQGVYFDAQDSGPDQASPDQIQQFQQSQQPVQPNTGYQPPTGGINPGPVLGGPIARPGPYRSGPVYPIPGGATTMPMHPPVPSPFDPLPIKPGAPIFRPGPSRAEIMAQHPDWPLDPFGQPYDPAVGYNSGIAGGILNRGGLGQLPGQIFGSGLQTQGGSMSDPRWMNGTWGGSLQMLGPKALL